MGLDALRDHAASDAFYSSIEPVDDFEALALPLSYVPLPDDWSIVAADIRGSTEAIEEGRYQDVNTVGVSVIAAVPTTEISGSMWPAGSLRPTGSIFSVGIVNLLGPG